jgi:hypothetical protein
VGTWSRCGLTTTRPSAHRFALDSMALVIPSSRNPGNCRPHFLSLCIPREASPELALAACFLEHTVDPVTFVTFKFDRLYATRSPLLLHPASTQRRVEYPHPLCHTHATGPFVVTRHESLIERRASSYPRIIKKIDRIQTPNCWRWVTRNCRGFWPLANSSCSCTSNHTAD